MTRARGYLPTLDGWRAVAILGVMIAHGFHALLVEGAPNANPTWYRITQYGGKGVDLFFGISGFLICSRLLEEHEQRGRISLRGFYIRRFMRILPPYFVYLATLIVLSAAGLVVLSRQELLTSLLFVRNYAAIPETVGWYTAHLWSLAVEEHFYLLWPGLLVFWTPGRARLRVALFALAIAAWRVAEFRLQLVPQLLPGASFYLRTDIRLDALLWGCWFALLLREPVWKNRIAKYLSGPTWWLAAAVLVAVIVLPVPLAMLWQAALWPAVVAGTVLAPDTLVGRGLEARPMRWVGRISYSLYLWQNLFLVAFGVSHFADPLQLVPWNFALCFVTALLSYRMVEKPMIRLGHRLAPPITEGRV